MRKFKVGDRVVQKSNGIICIIENIATCSRCNKYSIDTGIEHEDGQLHQYFCCENSCGDSTPITKNYWVISSSFKLYKPKKILIL